MSRPSTNPSRLLLEIVAVAVAYAVTARLGLRFAQIGGDVTLVWPPSGIAVAALVLRGPRLAWGVALGAAATILLSGQPPWAALIYAAGNTTGALLVARLFARRGLALALDRRGDVIAFLTATPVGMAIAPTVGLAILYGRGVMPAALLPQAWIGWWTGDVLGVIVVGAAILTSAAPAVRRGGRVELAALYVTTLLLSTVVFVASRVPIAFLTAGPLLWAGLRFSSRDALRLVLIIGALAVFGATHGTGPFARATSASSLIYLSAYLLTITISSLVLCALIAEWRRANDARRAAEERRVGALVAGALGTFEWDLAGGALRWDEGHCALFGIAPAEFDGTLETFASRVHPADLPRVMRTELQARDRREPYRIEYRVLSPDGGVRWVETRGQHTHDAAGVVVGINGVVQDITARKTAELALAEAHERLRLALEHGRMGIWDVEIGDAARRAELVALFEPEDRPAAAAALARTLEGEPFRVELRVRVEDGTPRWRSIYGAPHRTADGGLRLLGVVHDVNERVQIEEKLRRDAMALEALNRCQSELLAGADPGATFEGLLATVMEVSGSDRGLLAEVIEGTPAPSLRAHAAAGLAVADVEPRCAGVLAGAGTLVEPPPAAFIAVPLHHGPRVVGVLALAGRASGYGGSESRDLEPIIATGGHLIASWRERQGRERAEASLRAEQERSAGIIAAALDGILTVDEEGVIVDANPAAERIFGAGAAALRGAPIARLLPEGRRDPGRVGALGGVRADGSAVPLEVAIARVELDGRRLLTYTLRDVTERRHAEETRERLERQLREAQKMEAIGTLAGGIAHDFNNILGAVLGNVDLMRHDIEETHPAYESLVEVREASLRARDLVRQILAFSRRSESPRRAMSLAPVVSEAVRLMRSSLPKAVRIEVALDPACPAVVADASQLHQVVLNLGTNAFQALGRRDGRIDVTLEDVMVSAELADAHTDLRAGRWARLSVRDNGSGMDAATRERIFEPFFTTKPPGEGTGLGLAVVHGIIKAHGGAVLVDSELGKGTTFSVYLPLAPTAADSSQDHPVAVARGRGERVLFVDDEPALVAIGVRTLSRLGYDVMGAASPAAALDAVKADPAGYAAVVTDLTMPGMTGLELGVELLKLRPDLPLILVSGYGGGTGPDSAVALGFRDMLAKPASAEILASALRKAIDRPAG